MKRKHVRLGTIAGDLAERISQVLENEGVLWYKQAGPRILDVYEEK